MDTTGQAAGVERPGPAPQLRPSALSRRTLARLGGGFSTMATAVAAAACGERAGGGEPPRETISTAPVTFQYWDWATVWRDLVEQLAKAFAATHPTVTVQWDIAADYWTKLQVAIAGDTAPDSWRMNGPNLPQWVTLGLLEDVTPYFAKDKDATASLKAMAP